MNVNSKNGFSLVEIMIVGSMLAGLALVGMQLMKGQQDASIFAEIKNEELTLLRNMQMALVKKDVCQKTFEGKKVGDPIDSIIASKEATEEITLFALNTPINNLLKITSMTTRPTALPKNGGFGTFELGITIERIKKGSGIRSVPKSITIQAEVDEIGNILSCYSDVDSSIQNTKIEMCESLGGTFITEDNKCRLNSIPSNSDSEVVSKALLEKIITQLRTEYDRKIQAIQVADTEKPIDLNLLNLNSLSFCNGPSVRYRFEEASSTSCKKELQFRLCENGKWGEWSGSFTHATCN